MLIIQTPLLWVVPVQADLILLLVIVMAQQLFSEVLTVDNGDGLILHYDPANPKSYTYLENLSPYSEQIDLWANSSNIVFVNTATTTSPTGTTTAERIVVEGASTHQARLFFEPDAMAGRPRRIASRAWHEARSDTPDSRWITFAISRSSPTSTTANRRWPTG